MANDILTTPASKSNRDEKYKLRKRFRALGSLGTFGAEIIAVYDALGQDCRTTLTGFCPVPIWKILEGLQGFWAGTNDGIDRGPGISAYEFYEVAKQCQWLSFDFGGPWATVRLRSSEAPPDSELTVSKLPSIFQKGFCPQ